MELGPQNHNGDGLLGANFIIVVYMDPLGTPQPTKPASNPGPAQGLMTLNATKA